MPGCDVGQTSSKCEMGRVVEYSWQEEIDHCDALVCGRADDWIIPGTSWLNFGPSIALFLLRTVSPERGMKNFMNTKKTLLIVLIALIAGSFIMTGCDPGGCYGKWEKCEDGILYSCEDDETSGGSIFWVKQRDCAAGGGVCQEVRDHGAECVVPEMRCPKEAFSGCVGKNVHQCVGTYLELQVEERCEQFCMLSTADYTDDRWGTCTVSEEPCPPETLSFCQDGEVLVCGYEGFPLGRQTCGNTGQRCVEGVDAGGWKTAACALDTDCKESELSRCSEDKVYDCLQFQKPVLSQDCQAQGQHCVAPDDRLDAFCSDEADWTPYGNQALEWIAIRGDTFFYGDPETSFFDESIKVTVGDFELLKTEVTVAQYRSCVAERACTAPNTDDSGSHSNFSPGTEAIPFGLCNWDRGREDHPINCLNWRQAQDFCTWVSGRLPSETEWEFAARSRGKSFGAIPEANCKSVIMDDGVPGCGKTSTWPVCSREAGNTAQGLCDMRGNVAELVQDHWHEYLGPGTGQPTDGSAWVNAESSSSQVDGSGTDDASGPTKVQNTERVLRGGGYSSSSGWVDISIRSYISPILGAPDVGFRCAR